MIREYTCKNCGNIKTTTSGKVSFVVKNVGMILIR